MLFYCIFKVFYLQKYKKDKRRGKVHCLADDNVFAHGLELSPSSLYFPLGESKNFCCTIVTHFVVWDLCKNVR